MNTTILQVPLNKSLKAKSLAAAKEAGFSSLQEAVRVMLTKLSKKELTFSVIDQTALSPKNDARYLKMSQELDSQSDSFESVDDLMKDLRK